jgi:hypothetical protein
MRALGKVVVWTVVTLFCRGQACVRTHLAAMDGKGKASWVCWWVQGYSFRPGPSKFGHALNGWACHSPGLRAVWLCCRDIV